MSGIPKHIAYDYPWAYQTERRYPRVKEVGGKKWYLFSVEADGEVARAVRGDVVELYGVRARAFGLGVYTEEPVYLDPHRFDKDIMWDSVTAEVPRVSDMRRKRYLYREGEEDLLDEQFTNLDDALAFHRLMKLRKDTGLER